MRILYMTNGFRGLTPNGYGIATAVFNAAVGMETRGHEVHVLLQSDRIRTCTVSGVTCHEFKTSERSFRGHDSYDKNLDILMSTGDHHLIGSYQYWYHYVNLFRNGFVPDVIDCVDWQAPAYYLIHHRLLGYKEAVAPTLTTCHSVSSICYPYQENPSHLLSDVVLRQRERYQIVGSDALSAPSRYVCNLIESHLGPLNPVMCFNSSDHAQPQNLLPPCDNHDLLYFGRICQSKGIPALLRVCGFLWDEGFNFALKLMGQSTPYMALLIKKRYKRYIDGGHLQVIPPTDDFALIRERLAESRAVVLPSPMETFSYSCLEAISYGRPVICSSTGGQGEVIEHNGCGFIYNNLDELETYIKRILKASFSELEEWGLRGSHRAHEMFSPEKVLPIRERLYERVIEEHTNTKRTMFPLISFLGKSSSPHTCESPPMNTAENYVQGLLSVVVTCYNLGQFLEEAVRSVCLSRYRPIELIVMDDASIDHATSAALDDVETLYRNVGGVSLKVVRLRRNGGVAEARNLGAQICRGEFICFVDADDRVEPHFFGKAIDLLNLYANVGFVGGWTQEFGDRKGNWVNENFIFPLALIWNQALQSSVIRRRSFEKQKQSLAPSEDWEAYISIAEKGWIGISLPEPVLSYRVRVDSAYHSAGGQAFSLVHQRIAENHRDLLTVFGDDLYLLLCQNYPRSEPVGLRDHAENIWRGTQALWRHYLARPRDLLKFPYLLASVILSKNTKRVLRNRFSSIFVREPLRRIKDRQ